MMRPYHPSDGGADPGRELNAEEIKELTAKILKEMEAEEQQHPGRRCPKCGMSMAHYRLFGYRCIQRCQ